MGIQKIRIKGEKQINIIESDSAESLDLSASYVIGSSVRGVGEVHDIALKQTDMVEFVFEDNTRWLSSAEDVKEIFALPLTQNRGAENDVFEIPQHLSTDARNRGLVGDIALKLVKVFSKNDRDKAVKDRVRQYAVKLQKEQLENRSGLYRLDAGFKFHDFAQGNAGKPYLLFLHGTASSTFSSFGGLLGTPAWSFMTGEYGENIMAFQHETLTKSPLQNVCELVQQLPDNAILHLVSHSRGGLVGDVLSRFCVSDENNVGFSETELDYLKKNERVEDLQFISAIKEIILKKNISVIKFIRVACPASGTTIASQRLDFFFNIVMNLIGLAVGSVANPIYGAFKDLVSAVVDCKDDLSVLPGLEAMNPDSPFIKVLNNPAPGATVDGQLMVISGNSQVNLSFKALVIIATKLFFSSKNDLVVNTASMYNGARRTKPVQCFYDDEGAVDHFHYFSNKRTNDALMLALKTQGDGLVAGFAYQQQSSPDALRNAILNLEGGQVFKNTVSGKRPILVLLPGIMGSNLSNNGNLVWINYFSFLRGKLSDLEYNPVNNKKVVANSLIKTSYKDLADHLSGAYDVVTFPFDWRRQLNECAGLFNDKIIELMKFGQPIKIVGHSMGGVLVRDFIINYNDTWQKLNASKGFKLLFLGSPLGGSFRIPYVLYGFDEIISKIAKIDLFHTKKELLQIFCQLPGLLSLLPMTTDADNDFASEQTWKKMCQKCGDETWPIPGKAVLDEFKKYRDHINASSPFIDWSNAVYIAGKDASTPASYTLSKGKLEFIHTAAGDQSVTWDSGIPKKMIEQNTVYYSGVSHGGLSCSPLLFTPISEILSKGETALLPKTRPAMRSGESEFVAPPDHDFDISPEGLEKTLLGLKNEEVIVAGVLPLKATVTNGDLRFAKYPVLVGHFKKDAILNAEKAVDKSLKGSLTELHKLNLYPGNIGSSEIVLLQNNSFKGAIIAGLGEQGALTAFQLTQTVEQAAAKYLVNINNPINGHFAISGEIGLSSLLVGCGYGGLTIDDATRAILQGIQNANNKMKLLRPEDARTIATVEFIEIYEDKALSCLYTISKVAQEESQALNVSLDSRSIKKVLGARERMPIENTDEWWTRITVKQEEYKEGDFEFTGMQFNISTSGAREEERMLLTGKSIIDELLKDMSTNNHWSPETAKTIFELLIPNDFKEQLKKQNNINWIVDNYTASIPWELLQDDALNASPLSVNSGMIRQLSTQEYRIDVNQVTEQTAFILADPDLKGFLYQLPGAKREGDLVNTILSDKGFQTNNVTGTPGQIIKELFSKSYKIMHLAGHGIFNEDPSKKTGMLIGNDIYLSTKEICQMSTVPELVFVNCCYLGKMDGDAEAYSSNRYKLAANIGTQLIRNGVKAVVVSGWAVDDLAAHDFTEVFYGNLLNGYNFGEAVQNARKHIYEKYNKRNNTWGAYQCYGDPYYKLVQERSFSAKTAYSFVIAREAEIELSNLIGRLELSGISDEEHRSQLSGISDAVDKAQIRTGRITELEAIAYAALRDYEASSAKYGSLIGEENAVFSFAAMEQYCSVRIKHAVDVFKSDDKNRKTALSTAKTVIKDLEVLSNYSPTAERLNMLGGAYRRLALLSENVDAKLAAYEKAAEYYYQAYSRPGNTYKIHALSSWLNMENVLVLSGSRKWGEQTKNYKLWTLAKIDKELNDVLDTLSASGSGSNYWDMVAILNIKVVQYLLGKGSQTLEDIQNAYLQIWEHAGAKGKKISEIELCDLMIDAMSHISASKAQKNAADLLLLKNELMKHLD